MNKRQLHDDGIYVIDDFLSAEKCAELIASTEGKGYEEAPVSTAGGPVMAKEIRNNARLMVDDPAFAERLWKMAEPMLPATIDGWQPCGLNERLRYYRYDVGEKFAMHADGCFRRNDREKSKLTFMVYLNDDFEGGETVFPKNDGIVTVRPRTGSALVFLHPQWHEGTAVSKGRKYALRTDVMYRQG